GAYIIGATAPSDYPSFTAAVAALQLRGVGGPVVFNVRTGSYAESFNLPATTGASLTNTITFKSMANHVDSVVIVPSTSDAYIVRLEGANNTKFSKITFRSLSATSVQNGIVLAGAINNDTIVDCKIDMAIQTSYGNYMVYGTGLGNTFDGFVLKNNTMTGSYYGIYFFGQSNSYFGRFRNLVIDGNSITNTYVYSIYTYYSSNFIFNKNVIAPSSIYSGNINYFMYCDSINITNNTWNFTNNCTMYLGYYSYNSVGRRGLVANNVITGSGSMTSATIYLGYFDQYLDIMHNSFSVPSSNYCAYVYNTGAIGRRLKNNVFHNRGTGTAAYFAAAPIANVEANYNNYFTAGSILINGISSQATLQGWKAYSGVDKLSWSYNPGFTSTTNLMPDPTSPNSWSLNGRAEYQPSVPTDINGNPRVSNMANGVSDVGAYEFTPTSTPPLATAVPTTPVAGGTQSFLFGGDTIARIMYDQFATAPSSMGMRVYSGVTPTLIAPATAYPYFYYSAEAPSGTYTYNMTIKYKPIWMGTLPTTANFKLATKAPANAWSVLGSTNSMVDSVAYTISGLATLTDLPALFTAADDMNPLPVEMIRFTGVKSEYTANLNWSTATERNSSHFEVERSYTGVDFSRLGNVKSNGNSNSLKNYSFVDGDAFVNNEPIAYYRLKLVDRDGSFEYSNTISIENGKEEVSAEPINVFPNPFNNTLFIAYKSLTNEVVALRDLSGRLIMSQNLNAEEMVHQLNIPSSLDKGIYLLTFGSNRTKTVKVVRD
ncbi:MAG: T9SS type A sorting domain-containing protein, partial [bacterium]|nr:T9SS type A sorting domain-containing protein [bacterium]